jgi:phage-related minor tail protein
MADTSTNDDDSTLHTIEQVSTRTHELTSNANAFARAMSTAFSQSVIGGKQLDDVLKSLALRLSNMALTQAFKPLASGLSSGLNSLFSGLFSGTSGSSTAVAATSAAKTFAAGGVIGTPTYFPMMSGGLGLAGEAGPEAIVPLTRGRDGRLGIATAGGGGPNVTVQITTPNVDSFRRSESYLTGQIARAVARGQRSL